MTKPDRQRVKTTQESKYEYETRPFSTGAYAILTLLKSVGLIGVEQQWTKLTLPVDVVRKAVTSILWDYRDCRSIPGNCAEEMEGTLWCSEVSKLMSWHYSTFVFYRTR